MRTLILLIAIIFCYSTSYSQKKAPFKVRTIAFYNVENLFDTINHEGIIDDERTPHGKYKWDIGKYTKKLHSLSRVISSLNYHQDYSGPDVMGLCEVENRTVIEDLVQQKLLIPQRYKIIHRDSPDARGIDVALIYKEGVFIPGTINSHKLILQNENGSYKHTRNQMVVSGYMDGNEIAFIVNHWPSRSGGVALTKKHRLKAAQLNKKIIDSLQQFRPQLKIVNLGDFNDNPTDFSIKKVLHTRSEKVTDNVPYLYNPMEKMYKKGMGSLAFRDKWFLFDQIILSSNMLQSKGRDLMFWQAGVYQPDFIKNKNGNYKNYPYRTYNGSNYAGGFSDHFPVFVHLIQPASKTVADLQFNH